MAFSSETYADVGKRIPTRTIGTTNEPTQTTVNAWLTEGEGRLRAALAARDIAIPGSGDGVTVLVYLTVTYGVGRTKEAYAAAAGDGGNDDGQRELEEFAETLTDIRNNPGEWDAILNGPSSTSGASGFRSHVTDDFKSRASDSNDFEPVFNKLDAGDQF